MILWQKCILRTNSGFHTIYHHNLFGVSLQLCHVPFHMTSTHSTLRLHILFLDPSWLVRCVFWAAKMSAPLFCNSPLLSISQSLNRSSAYLSNCPRNAFVPQSSTLPPASYLYIYLVFQLHQQSPFPMQFSRDANDFDWHVNEYPVPQC